MCACDLEPACTSEINDPPVVVDQPAKKHTNRTVLCKKDKTDTEHNDLDESEEVKQRSFAIGLQVKGFHFQYLDFLLNACWFMKCN